MLRGTYMKSCCFIGHRKIDITEKIIVKIESIIENLIENGVTTFYFGSKSQFNDLCLKIVTKLKGKYSNLYRVYIAPNMNI